MAQSLRRPLLTAARLSPFERRCFTQFAPRMAKGGRGPAAHRGATPAEPSFRLQSKEMMTKTPDIGLLGETFIAPTGKNLPSIFHAPGALLRMRWIQLKSSLRDYFSLLILKITSPQGKRWYNRFVKLHRARVVPTAIALHREMYSAFAAGDATTLRRICTDGIYDQFRARMAARPRGEKTVWELVKYNNRARIVSHRAARLPIDGAAVRQAVVRLSSRQKLSRYAADGRLVKGTGKERDVVEYLVVEKSYWNWQEGDWRVWGTTEETKLETVLQWQKDALDAGN